MFDQSGNFNSSVCLPKHHCSNGWQFTIDEGEGEGEERKKERKKEGDANWRSIERM